MTRRASMEIDEQDEYGPYSDLDEGCAGTGFLNCYCGGELRGLRSMKKTSRKEMVERLRRLRIPCQICGQAPASRYNKIGMAVCGKSHDIKKRF